MRTTITFDEDVAAAIRRVQKTRHVGVSEAVNSLVRQGLGTTQAPPRFTQRTSSGGALLDLTDVADVLDLIDGPGTR